jgi:hypothetical protein
MRRVRPAQETWPLTVSHVMLTQVYPQESAPVVGASLISQMPQTALGAISLAPPVQGRTHSSVQHVRGSAVLAGLSPNSCDCPANNYFDDSVTHDCRICHFYCATCDGST